MFKYFLFLYDFFLHTVISKSSKHQFHFMQGPILYLIFTNKNNKCNEQKNTTSKTSKMNNS